MPEDTTPSVDCQPGAIPSGTDDGQVIMTPQEFVAKWRGNTSTERQASQQHFLDLCALVGHPTPAELDPDNKFFTFEAGATKQSGGQGWADVWYRGHFAIEYKGPDKNLDRAYGQLLQYRESLENPPLLITGNTQEYFIHTNFTNSTKQVVRVTLDDLLTPQGIQHIRNIFYNPEAFRPEKTAAQVTEEAAARFAQLAEHLRKWGHQPHDIAHYLIRLLFCMFAEDTGLLPRDVFTRMVEGGRRNPQGFNRQVRQLFQAMSEGDSFGEHQIRYFDGGLAAAVAIYKMDGRKHTYATFVLHLARKGIDISVATFKRWLETYEQHTGEQVRPGRGKRAGGQL